MKCPKCKDRTEVLQTEAGASETKRRRRCLSPTCGFRFATREQANLIVAASEITTESVLISLSIKKSRRLDVEAVAAAVAVDQRRAAMKREQRGRDRIEWDNGFEPAPAWLDQGELRREIKGY